MSKRLDVIEAVKSLVASALPGATVLGLDEEESAPRRIPAGGLAIVATGDPGTPEVVLSPLAYHYDHRIIVELLSASSDGGSLERPLDAMMAAIGSAIMSNRTLGGLADWLDAEAPVTEPLPADEAAPARGASLAIIASYSTANPLN